MTPSSSLSVAVNTSIDQLDLIMPNYPGKSPPQGQALARFLPWAAGDTDLTAWRQGPC